MSNVINFQKRDDDHFGLCPVCKKSPQIMNVHQQHFGICPEHKVAWSIGWNLLSGWQHESESDWTENRRTLEAEYRPVIPFYWSDRRASA